VFEKFRDSDARFSQCQNFRYVLFRRFGEGKRVCTFIGLNPSTADAERNDPTIRRCINFAQGFGYDGLAVINLFAFRATYPEDLKAAEDPVGPRNNYWIKRVVDASDMVLACWGVHGAFLGRDEKLVALLGRQNLHCLGQNQAGSPKHPLYLRSDTIIQPFA
jgi:hypothetical protein